MAAFDFYTTDGTLLFAPTRKPSYPLEISAVKNVVASETPGGVTYSHVRGEDRRRLVLHWGLLTAADLASFLSWHAVYGRNRLPFAIELPASITDYASGTHLRVRSPAVSLDYTLISAGYYELDLVLLEDLAPTIVSLSVSETIAFQEQDALAGSGLSVSAVEAIALQEQVAGAPSGLSVAAAEALDVAEQAPTVSVT